MKYFFKYISLLLCVFVVERVAGQPLHPDCTNRISNWEKIAPYFVPPVEFKDQFGEYRSPLKFCSGETVQHKKDWIERRKEIRNCWMEMMGEWPPLLENQEFEIIGKEKREDFTQFKVRFYWTPNEQTEGYLLVPDKKGKKPAVITVYYEPETAIGIGSKPYRDFAYQLTKRGFVTLSLGTAETTGNKTYSIYYPSREDAGIQPVSALAYAAANALEALSKVTDVDRDRIGIVGHSYGGKWAMFASCLYDKFAAAVWIDPGIVFDETKGSAVNYWEPWYLGYYAPPWGNIWNKNGMNAKGLYPILRSKGRDLHELHALMAPRPFLVSGGSSDPVERWIALNHTVAVNKLLGYTDRVAMSNRAQHSPDVQSNETVYSFLEWSLAEKGQWQPLFKTAQDTVNWTSMREETPFPNKGWIVKKKELILLPAQKGGDMVSKRKYSDFELKLEFKMTKLVNSGVKYFVHQMFNNENKRTEWIGFEYQIIDDFHRDEIGGFNDDKGSTAALYLLYAPDKNKKLKPLGTWNSLRIKVQGNKVEHWLNGEMVVSADIDSDEFKDRVQVTKFKNYDDFGKKRDGHILLQDHGSQIHYRNIMIKEL